MKEVSKEITYKGETYKIVFNLNVMQEIQAEYKTLGAWGAIAEGNSNDGEPDIKALIFGLAAMINEGIDIDNEERATLKLDKKPFLSHKAVGRMLTEIGLNSITDTMNGLVIESTKTDDGKNA